MLSCDILSFVSFVSFCATPATDPVTDWAKRRDASVSSADLWPTTCTPSSMSFSNSWSPWREMSDLSKKERESRRVFLKKHKDLSVYLDIDIDTAILYIYIYSRIHTYIPYLYILYIHVCICIFYMYQNAMFFSSTNHKMAESPPRWCRSDSSGKRSWGPCRAARPATELG